MPTLKQAETLRKQLEKKLKNKKSFAGIEIAALKKEGVYTDEPCIRILVNDSKASYDELGINKTENNITIQIEYKVIKPQ